MNTVPQNGFQLVKSTFNGLCKLYFKKNIDNVKEFKPFMDLTKPHISELLSKAVEEGPLKYSLKLEATYVIPNTEIIENRAFKTLSRPLFLADHIS